MVKVYLKAKTFDNLIIKQQMFNTFAGYEYQFNESYYAKGEFYVTFKCDINKWKRASVEIEKRFKKKKPKKTEGS